MKALVQRLKSTKIDENVCRTYESSSACAVLDAFLNMWEPKQGSDGAVRVWMECAISLDLWMASIVVGGAVIGLTDGSDHDRER